MDQSHVAVRNPIANFAPKPGSLEGAVREFLAFKRGDEAYGIDILRVQEIRSFEHPTRMANAPAYILGVVNLRGVIVRDIEKLMVSAEMGLVAEAAQ